MPRWSLVLGLSLVGCRAGVEGSLQLEGGVGGCFSLVDGDTCITKDPGRVVVWVEDTSPDLRLSGAPGEVVEGGSRWIVPVDTPTELVVVDGLQRPRFAVWVRPEAGPWRDALYAGASCAPEPDGADPDVRAFYLSGRARCAEEADPLTILEQAIAAHRARGDGMRLDWDLAMWGELAPHDQPVPGGIWLPSERSLESRYFWGFHHGRRANGAGNLADAHRYLDEARAMAMVLAREDGGQFYADSVVFLAENLSQASRFTDAHATITSGLDRLETAWGSAPTCQLFSLLSTVAWFGGMASQPTDESLIHLDRADELLASDEGLCPSISGARWQAAVNRAFVLARGKDWSTARDLLATAPLESAPDPQSRAWAEVFRSEVALATGQPEAVSSLLQPHLVASGRSPFGPQAHRLAGLAHQKLGRPDAAIAAFRAGLDSVELLARRAPLGLSRGSMLDATTDTSWRLAAALDARGDRPAAFSVLRAHRRRALLGLRQAAVAGGTGAYRGLSWSALRAAHDTGDTSRSAWEDDSGGGPLAALTAPPDSGLPPRVAAEMERFLQADPARPSAPVREPRDEEVFVLVGVHDEKLEIWTSTPEAGIGRSVQPDPGDLGHRLDAVVRVLDDHLAASTTVVFLPIGTARSWPLARAEWRGRPLGLQRTILTSLDLGIDSSPTPPRTAAVLADPTHDLVAAREEGRAVAAALDGTLDVDLRVGEAATDAALVALLTSDIDLVHFAGHAAFADDGWSSGLALAGGTQLAAWQLLALERVPPIVSMTACESSRTVTGQTERLGLAQAFVLAGSQAVLAADVPVADDLARTYGEAWARALATGASPPEAWRVANLAAAAAHPDAPWWTLRLWTP